MLKQLLPIVCILTWLVPASFACGSNYTDVWSDGSYVFARSTTESDQEGWFPVAVRAIITSPVFGRQESYEDGFWYPNYSSAVAEAAIEIAGESGQYVGTGLHFQDQAGSGGYQQFGTSGDYTFVSATAREFVITHRSFIPPQWVHGADSCTNGNLGTVLLMFKGDNRTFQAVSNEFRGQTRVKAVPTQGTVTGPGAFRVVGQSKSYALFFEEDSVGDDCWKWHQSATGSNQNMNFSSSISGIRAVRARVFGGISNPLHSISPEINWDVFVEIDSYNIQSPTYSRSGSHDCYPDHEVYIDQQMIHNYTPPQNDPLFIGGCLTGALLPTVVGYTGHHPIY